MILPESRVLESPKNRTLRPAGCSVHSSLPPALATTNKLSVYEYPTRRIPQYVAFWNALLLMFSRFIRVVVVLHSFSEMNVH